MNDTPKPPAGALPQLGLLRFQGRDALAFLQGQLSNDVRPLASGKTLRAAYCTPQGRVLAVIYLVPSQDGALAILPRELIAPLIERLKKFVLRSKVVMQDLTESLSLLGAHAESLKDLNLDAGVARETDGVVFARVPHDEARLWLIGAPQRLAALGLAKDAGIEGAWRLADIEAGLPQVYGATSDAFVAQMLNLDLLDGISFNKGCYTGQEIIARTQHLGRIKRRMFHLALPAGEWRIGQSIKLSDGRQGRITELAQGTDALHALAVLNLAAAGEAESEVAGNVVQAREVALPYSLAAAAAN